MRIGNIDSIYENGKNFCNKNTLIFTEEVRNYLVSKGFFEIGTIINDNMLKYMYVKTQELQVILKEGGMV